VGHNTTNIRDTLADAVDTAINQGSGAGLLRFYTASYAATLCTITLNDPAFGASSSGTITLDLSPNGYLEGTCGAGGVLAKFRFLDSDGNEIVNGDVGISGQDINFANTTVSTNDVLRITGLTYSAPA